MNTETHTRTWARVLVYKAVAFAITAVWAGMGGALAIQVILTIVQVVMERAWLKVKWGLRQETKPVQEEDLKEYLDRRYD